MNAMLSDRLALEQRRRFGKSSEKYADGYEQLCLFNEAERNADVEDTAMKKSSRLLIRERNGKERRKQIFLISKLQKQRDINWMKKNSIVQSAVQNIKLLQKRL